MNPRADLADLLRKQILLRIPEPTAHESEMIDVLAAYGSYAPTLFLAPYTRATLQRLSDLSQTLAGGLAMLGQERMAGTRIEQYCALATHMADVTRLMIERPAGRA